MTPEGKVKRWLKRELRKRYPSMWIYAAPGGRFGSVGTPDYLYCIEGLFVAIEVKTLRGKVTPMQRHVLSDIHTAGGIRAVIFGEDEERLDAIMSAINKKISRLQRV